MIARKERGYLAFLLTLSAGMTGLEIPACADVNSPAEIRSVQQKLKNDGYYYGRVDGIDSKAIRSAIREYQKDNHLAVSGRLDSETSDKLGVNAAGDATWTATGGAYPANRSMSGNSSCRQMNVSRSDIQAAQRQLQVRGFFSGKIDGLEGASTAAAIRQFQKRNGLNITGRLDEDTLNSLGIATSDP